MSLSAPAIAPARNFGKATLHALYACATVAALWLPAVSAHAAEPAPAATAKVTTALDWQEEYAYLMGMQAYIYGFPAIMYANLRYQWIESGQGPVQMGVNEYWHSRTPSDPKLQYGGSPNRETPYSMAFIDVSKEPVVLTVPKNPENRYYTLQLIDFYSDTVGYIGQRATKNVAGDYLLAGPGWKGQVPKGIKGVYRSWTPWAMIAGRTYSDGSEADLVKMRAVPGRLQDHALVPVRQARCERREAARCTECRAEDRSAGRLQDHECGDEGEPATAA